MYGLSDNHFKPVTDDLFAADPRVRRLLRYWRSLRDGALLPSRKSIDPTFIVEMLPNIVFYEVMTEGGQIRFKYRLAGTAVVELLGREVTGEFCDEIFNNRHGRMVINTLKQTTITKQPHYGLGCVPARDREYIEIASLTLPLAENGADVDRLLGLRLRVEH